MGQSIRIIVDGEEFSAELNDSETAEAIVDSLPLDASGSRWGDEIYFSIPVDCPEADDARDEFEVGELGYWPPGNAFCIFYGPTPASRDGEPRMANPGNPIGRITEDATRLRDIEGSEVRIELADHE
ncbi:MAG: hypothetical protein ACI9G1_005219 [Pirellulaceae bacterium]|jgi:hypothetical protein